MSITDSAVANIVANAVEDHPAPKSFAEVDAHTRIFFEERAEAARLTPEGLWHLHRSRQGLTPTQAVQVRSDDRANSLAGRPHGTPIPAPPVPSPDEIVAAIRG
ncbi:hypothetical protein [Microbacterium gorillae]|uniref:hypothetical protein n=1 Tax=Microbacterium gorillae TaxID=1231063 RepID=UPI00058FE588|nr:hypothetical protein [Microbacterium gorillae]